MSPEDKIKQLTLVAHYARIRLNEAGHYSNAIQITKALEAIKNDESIPECIETTVNFHLN